MKHVGEERRRIHRKMLEFGIGVGSLIEIKGDNNKTYVCVVPSMDFIPNYVQPEYQIMKRTNRCRVTIQTVDHNCKVGINDCYIYTKRADGFFVNCHPLEDMSATYSAFFYIDPTTGNPLDEVPHYYWRRPAKVVVPSSDSDFTEDHARRPFRIHRRLCLEKEKRDYLWISAM